MLESKPSSKSGVQLLLQIAAPQYPYNIIELSKKVAGFL